MVVHQPCYFPLEKFATYLIFGLSLVDEPEKKRKKKKKLLICLSLQICLALCSVAFADVTVEQARERKAIFEAKLARHRSNVDGRAPPPVINGEPSYVVPKISPSTPALTCGTPNVEYCTVELMLYDQVGVNYFKTKLDFSRTPSSVSVRPPNGIFLNPFYGGLPFNNGCDSGVSIYNPNQQCCPISALVRSVWDPTNGYDSTWSGVGCNGTNGCTAASCPSCAGYNSQIPPRSGTITIPLMQV